MITAENNWEGCSTSWFQKLNEIFQFFTILFSNSHPGKLQFVCDNSVKVHEIKMLIRALCYVGTSMQ
jgi:hypothetical protein